MNGLVIYFFFAGLPELQNVIRGCSDFEIFRLNFSPILRVIFKLFPRTFRQYIYDVFVGFKIASNEEMLSQFEVQKVVKSDYVTRAGKG